MTTECTEKALSGRSQGARPRHGRSHGEGAQRGERPDSVFECKRISRTGH